MHFSHMSDNLEKELGLNYLEYKHAAQTHAHARGKDSEFVLCEGVSVGVLFVLFERLTTFPP